MKSKELENSYMRQWTKILLVALDMLITTMDR